MAKRPHALADILSGSLPGEVSRRLPGPGLLAAWGKAAGETIAQRARPVCVEEGGVMVVAVPSSVWRQELSMNAPSLAAKLRELGQEIQEIKLVLATTPPPRTPPPPPPRELGPKDEGLIADMLKDVEDEGLRESLRNLMRAQMSRHTDPGT